MIFKKDDKKNHSRNDHLVDGKEMLSLLVKLSKKKKHNRNLSR